MSYLVLARKWRPQSFEQIRGQEHIVRALRNAITSARIAHAYLFTGIRGVGKTSAARVLAKALNCASGPTPTPCNECASCREITEGRSSDVLEIDGASNTGVEDVRRLREAVRYPPVRGPYRVYIVDEVHMLSTAAFNALLKTLEEPPPHVVFIFATTDPHKIPVTILSRCQQFDFKRLSLKDMAALLGDVASAEGVSLDERSVMALAREAEGSVRDGQSLLDQVISYAGQSVAYEDVRDVLGVVDRDLLLGVAKAVAGRDGRSIVQALQEAERFGYDVRRFAHDLLDVFRDLSILKAVPEGDDLVELAPEEVDEARRFLQDASWDEIHALYDVLARGVEGLRTAPRPGTVLEMTLLKMARMPALLPLSEVMSRVRAAGLDAAPPASAGGAAPAPQADRAGATGRVPERPAPSARPAPAAPPRSTPAPAQSAPAPAPAVETAGETSPEVPRGAEEFWIALLAAAETMNRPLWNVLRAHGRVESWDPGARAASLVFDDPGQEFFVQSRSDMLGRLLAQVAGRGAKVQTRSDAAREPKGRGPARDTDHDRKLKRDALGHPLVRDALELFEGDVEDVKLRKP